MTEKTSKLNDNIAHRFSREFLPIIEGCIINAMVSILKTPIMPGFEQRFIAL